MTFSDCFYGNRRFQKHAQAYTYSNLMARRQSRIHTFQDVIRRIKLVPVMTDFTDEEIGVAFEHPAVKVREILRECLKVKSGPGLTHSE